MRLNESNLPIHPFLPLPYELSGALGEKFCSSFSFHSCLYPKTIIGRAMTQQNRAKLVIFCGVLEGHSYSRLCPLKTPIPVMFESVRNKNSGMCKYKEVI